MANEYYERLSEMNPGDLADGLAMEAEFDAISQGFSKLPTPHTGGQGFDGPVRVGDAVNTDEAVSLGQLNAAIGEAVLLPIATYGNLSATAWETLPSNTYLLFGTGAQFSNTPYALVAGSTYYLQVRHVIGGSGVAIYHDQLSLASTDDSANVDLRRLFVRTGGTFASAVSGGWVGFTLKKAALTALESLSPSANQIAYYTSAGAAAMTPLTAFARSLLDAADADAARNTLTVPVRNPGNLSGMDCNLLIEGGMHRLGSSPVNTPPGNWGYGNLLVIQSGDTLAQMIFDYLSSNVAFRVGHPPEIGGTGSWQPWRMLYHAANIIGTVSQSSGIPTGAIIERGSNANGEYTKFADGSLFCMQRFNLDAGIAIVNTFGSTSGNGYITADTWWTFPHSFVGVPYTWGNPEGVANHGGASAHMSNVTATSGVRRFWVNSTGVCSVCYFALGRWF